MWYFRIFRGLFKSIDFKKVSSFSEWCMVLVLLPTTPVYLYVKIRKYGVGVIDFDDLYIFFDGDGDPFL